MEMSIQTGGCSRPNQSGHPLMVHATGKPHLRQLPLEELDGVRHHAATRIHDVLSPGLGTKQRNLQGMLARAIYQSVLVSFWNVQVANNRWCNKSWCKDKLEFRE